MENSSYLAYGLGIYSEIPLPKVLSAEITPDVIISIGKINPTPPSTAVKGINFWANSENVYLIYQKVGAFFISGGVEITVELFPHVDEQELHRYLLGPIIAILLQQRGILTLHGSSCAIKEKVISFLGCKGWGKSTLTAALCVKEHKLIADDLTAIQINSSNSIVLPGLPQIRLEPDVLTVLGYDPEAFPKIINQPNKRAFQISQRFSALPFFLHRIYILSSKDNDLSIDHLDSQNAFVELVRHTYLINLFKATGAIALHFHHCICLANSISICRLNKPKCLSALPDVVKFIEEDMALN